MDERSFETDSAKAGFERVESYEYDVYGRVINTVVDVLGDELDVNSQQTFEKDEFGRNKVVYNYQSNGALIWKREFEHDEYGYIIKQTNYTSETTKSITTTYVRDEIGREMNVFEDKNSNGIFDANDTKRTMVYDQYLNGNYIERIDETPSRVSHTLYSYDAFDRRATSFIDLNGNKLPDSNEEFLKYYYHGAQTNFDYWESYKGEDLIRVFKYIYPDAGTIGTQLGALSTDIIKGETVLSYGISGIFNSSKDDYTSQAWSALLDNYQGKIITINLSNTNAYTDITLDNDVCSAPKKQRNTIRKNAKKSSI